MSAVPAQVPEMARSSPFLLFPGLATWIGKGGHPCGAWGCGVLLSSGGKLVVKKTIVAVLGMMLAATAAQAEHKLLVTEILEPKQVEAQALFEYTHARADLRSP